MPTNDRDTSPPPQTLSPSLQPNWDELGHTQPLGPKIIAKERHTLIKQFVPRVGNGENIRAKLGF